jgi:hypothetical protein
MVALALPLEPATMLSHAASDTADQEHPASVARSTERLPPDAATESLFLLSRNVHGAAAWLS